MKDAQDRALPLAWRRKCNQKLYGLTQISLWPGGRVTAWLRVDGNNALHRSGAKDKC